MHNAKYMNQNCYCRVKTHLQHVPCYLYQLYPKVKIEKQGCNMSKLLLYLKK